LHELQGGTSSKKLKVAAEVVKIAKNQVEKNIKSLAPLSGQEYASNRLKLEEKQAEAIKSGGIEDSALHQAQAFICDNKESLQPSSKSTKTSTHSSTKIATVTFGQDQRSSKSSELSVPGPANGKVYSPREVLDIVIPLGKREHGFINNELVRLRFVEPTLVKALRDLVHVYKDKPDCCPEWWGQRGHKGYAPETSGNY
jgi:hypothetical protein